MIAKPWIAALASILSAALPPAVGAETEPGPQGRRLDVLRMSGEKDLPRLAEAVRDPDPLVRRAAVRSLGGAGVPAVELLKASGSGDSDALVRRTALRVLVPLLEGDERVRALKTALEDSSEYVRLAAVEGLAALNPCPPQALALLQEARHDPSPLVSQGALKVLWPFNAAAVSARDQPQYRDLLLETALRIDLPAEGWKFHADAGQAGHLQGWQEEDFDDGPWRVVGIGKPWQDFGIQHEGVAWYRVAFTLPAYPARGEAVDLVFEGVDESAWIWLNGRFVGAHHIGPQGYDKRFAADVGGFLKWGERNRLAVRVSKPSGNHGGIWKPVYLEVLKKN